MTPSGQTICLCMIVKDEAPVIRRCLDSVRPLIDRWLIVDTGSADGTQEIVREHFRDIPGDLVERPWRDFAHNRSEALALARPHGAYTLIIDADDAMVVPDGFRLPDLDADSYTVDIDFGTIRYQRPQLVRSALGWRYEGVIHEYLVCEDATTSGTLPLVLRIHQDGARRRDPDTFRKDVAVLERAIAEETDPFRLARYTFYLAQSYRDSGEGEKAAPLYLRRAEMGFWDQEVYCSLLYAGRLMQALGRDATDVLAVYARAAELCPMRAEARHAASFLHRSRHEFRLGYYVAKPAIDLPAPPGGLFVEAWIYEYGLLDEFGVNAYWSAHYTDCHLACARLLTERKLPDHMIPRIQENQIFAGQKLALERLVFPDQHDPGIQDDDSRASSLARVINSDSWSIYTKQSRIVRTIHIVWVGDESRRPDNCIETWRRLNPDWTIKIWGNQELRSGRWKCQEQMRQMVTRELNGVADMMRWEILERYGGFAMDADAVCIRPLETWLFEPEIFTCWENEIARPGLMAAGYVYAHPHNALIERIVDDIGATPDITTGLAWQTVGPQRLTDTVHSLKYYDATVYPSHYFLPEHLSGARYRGTGPVFCRQLWGATRGNVYETLASRDVLELVNRG